MCDRCAELEEKLRQEQEALTGVAIELKAYPDSDVASLARTYVVRCAALEAECAKLREALEPFASLWVFMDMDSGQHNQEISGQMAGLAGFDDWKRAALEATDED